MMTNLGSKMIPSIYWTSKLNSDFGWFVALGVFHLTLYSPIMGLSKHGYQAAAARRAGEEAERPFCGLSLEKFWTALSCSMFTGHEKMGTVAKHDAFLVTFVQHLLDPSASVVDPKYRDSRSPGQWVNGGCLIFSLALFISPYQDG